MRHIVIKPTKIKYRDKVLKSKKGKRTYKGTPIKLSADFSTETLQARREWNDVFRVMKGKELQPRILYPEEFSFRFDGEIKSFTDKQKLKRIQHHQTSFTTNAKGNSLGKKHKTRNRPTENKPKTIRKVVIIGSYILMITLQVNE